MEYISLLFLKIQQTLLSICTLGFLKLVSIFLTSFCFSPNDSPLETMKDIFHFI